MRSGLFLIIYWPDVSYATVKQVRDLASYKSRFNPPFSTKGSKITKILNSKENSKRQVPNQMAKSKVQTHQTNG